MYTSIVFKALKLNTKIKCLLLLIISHEKTDNKVLSPYTLFP